MSHKAMLMILMLVVTGCVSQDEKALRMAQAIECEGQGGTVYKGTGWTFFECVSSKEQERLERLELACVSAGGTVEYSDWNKKYENCKKEAPSVNVEVNNNPNTWTAPTICITQKCKERRGY
jgi:hypothetical protein